MDFSPILFQKPFITSALIYLFLPASSACGHCAAPQVSSLPKGTLAVRGEAFIFIFSQPKLAEEISQPIH